MKKTNMKKAVLPIVLAIVIVLSVIAIGVVKKERFDNLKETESKVVESSQNEIVNATEKKEEKTTEKATEEKSTSAKVEKTTNTQADAPVADTTKKVVPTTQASKPVDTTKPVETTKKPADTKPTKPTTTKTPKDEYYPALTAADMKTLEAYCKQYVESKGYTYDTSLNWDNCGFSSTVGLSGSMSSYGNDFKVGVGETPLEYAKSTVRGAVNANIYDFGDRDWLSMVFLYEKTTNGWEWTVGYMA